MNTSVLNETYVSRQPILDRQQDLVGYELALQSVAGGREAPNRRHTHASTLACSAYYSELGIQGALGQSRAFLPTDEEFLHDGAVESLPSDAVVLEIDLDPDLTPAERTLGRCRALRERRYSLALSDYSGLDDRSRPLLTLVDIVKIDIRDRDDAELSKLAGPLSRLPIKLLAQNVETRDAMERCHKIGFQLFQGSYFTDTEIVSGRRLSASQASLIRLINLASLDVDAARLEEGIKHEPALAVNLLRIVNSVGYGLTRQISSLRHAVALLGRSKLQRWLQLLLMTPDGKAPDVSRSPLLQVAALRGRMMELLINHSHPRNTLLADQAFITGIMSMMPTALGMPMNEIFEQIALEQEIVAALQSYQGTLGKMLMLIECYDAEDADGCDAILAGFLGTGLDRNMLNHCLTESLRWINGSEEAD